MIRPNRSLSWRETRWVYAFIAGYSLLIAGGLAVLGFWPVLPFAGGEVVALGVCFYLCADAGRATDVVVVGEDTVAVSKSGPGATGKWEFQRSWARVSVLAPRLRWYPSRLVIRSHGRQVYVGDFLSEPERRDLAAVLRRAIARAV